MEGDLGINAYLREARKTAIYPAIGNDRLVYPILKLNGEAGEVAELLGKMYRDQIPIEVARPKLIDELGDVAWYWVNICNELGVAPSVVLERNLEKLARRVAEGKIHGEGSDR